jgi:hypothetical protein
MLSHPASPRVRLFVFAQNGCCRWKGRSSTEKVSPPPQQLPIPWQRSSPFQQPSPFCHPERTRVSYFTALTGVTYVVLLKENHMQLFEAATLDRKCGKPRDLQCAIRMPQSYRSTTTFPLPSRALKQSRNRPGPEAIDLFVIFWQPPCQTAVTCRTLPENLPPILNSFSTPRSHLCPKIKSATSSPIRK